MLSRVRREYRRSVVRTNSGRGSIMRTLYYYSRTTFNAKWYLRRAQLGPRIRVEGHPVVTARGEMIVADRVQLYSTNAKLELMVDYGARLEVGSRTLINFGTSISAYEHVSIGANCHIGPFCIVTDNNLHELDPERRLVRPPSQPVIIGDNVWLGARVLVLPGVTIGQDAAVGAGSVVTHDVPPRTLAVGVPARVVRQL
jgi:maltose O-acetyltransferase